MEFKDKVYPVRKSKKIFDKKEKPKFSNGVHKVVRKIPRGKVMVYAEVARRAGFCRAWRAVGNILAKNRSPEIPCHRVIKSNGEIGGYNRGTKKKIELLKKEGLKINPFDKLRVNTEQGRSIKNGKIR